MLKRSLTLGLMFAVLIGGAVWAQRSAPAMSVTGQVSSVDSIAGTVTDDAGGGSVSLNIDGGTNAELWEMKVGDRVRVDSLSGVVGGARVARAKRRPLFRLRRPLTI